MAALFHGAARVASHRFVALQDFGRCRTQDELDLTIQHL
jgi:hypothetical protein